MDSFTLGKYIPLNALMHKFDPRAKILAMLLLMIAIFMPSGFIGYIGIVLVILLGIYASKLNLKFFWKDSELSLQLRRLTIEIILLPRLRLLR